MQPASPSFPKAPGTSLSLSLSLSSQARPAVPAFHGSPFPLAEKVERLGA
jgi:hypothetical protein